MRETQTEKRWVRKRRCQVSAQRSSLNVNNSIEHRHLKRVSVITAIEVSGKVVIGGEENCFIHYIRVTAQLRW